jgi:tetratricopeptide (TPR) repeat protein
LALAYNNRGASYNNVGEPEKAIADYNEAIRLNPEYAGAYYNRGSSYFSLGNKQKAIEDLQKAADLWKQQGDTENYQNALSSIEQLNN